MLRRYASHLLLVTMMLQGCASAPSGDDYVPTSDKPQVPAEPVKDAEGKHRYVLALMEQEDWHQAVQELELLTAGRPELPGPWVNLGIVHTMLGDSGAAEAAFRQALAADDGNAEAWNQLGMLQRRSGRLEEARASYNAGLQREPDNASLHWNLAILHDLHLPEPALALAHYDRYQQLTKDEDPQLAVWIAKLRQQVPATEPEEMTAEAKK